VALSAERMKAWMASDISGLDILIVPQTDNWNFKSNRVANRWEIMST
jgi:hypothetical protein